MTSVSAVVDHVFSLYPQVARRAGRHDFDARLPLVEPRSTTEIDGLLATVSGQLDALPESADPERRADLGTAVQVLADERFQIAELGRVHCGPLDWIAETDVSVYLRGSYAPLEDRLAALEEHLVQLPSFLGSAAKTFGPRLPAGDRISGIELARSRAVDIRGLVADHPDLAESASAAADACEAFAAAVAATGPTKALMGPELLAGFLAAAEGLDQPVDELLAEARAEVDEVAARLDALAGRLGVDNRWQAYDLMGAQVRSGSVLATLDEMVERLERFWVEQDVVSITTRTELEIRRARDPLSSAEVVFDVGGALERIPQPHLLYVPEPADAGEGGVRRDYLNDPMLEMIAVHEVFPGHYLHYEAPPPEAHVIRKCIPWFPGTTEGWAHYAEELAVERGLAEGRPLIEVARLRFALECATRLLIFLSVHIGQWSFGAAAANAAQLCGWSPERAAREVLIVVADPGGAMYALGRLRIREWRRQAGVGSAAADLKPFHDRLLRCGNAPLATVWRYHLDGQRLAASVSGAAS